MNNSSYLLKVIALNIPKRYLLVSRMYIIKFVLLEK